MPFLKYNLVLAAIAGLALASMQNASAHSSRSIDAGQPAQQAHLAATRPNLSGQGTSTVFTQHLPYVQGTAKTSVSLAVQQSISNANYIVLRSPRGRWQAIGTGADNEVDALAFGKNDDYLYIGGAFSILNGVADTRGIARYSLATGQVSAMGG